MTHEIHVVAGTGDAVDEGRLIASLLAAGWQAPADAAGLAYANPDTGVTASIEALTTSLPAGYRGLDLGLVLNDVRASWFGLETIPAFSAAVGSSGALVFDPQADKPRPEPPDTDELIGSWIRGNGAAVAAARASGEAPPWLDPDRSIGWWRYQRALPRLRRGFAADLYVPSVRLVRRSGSDRVERAMSWPDHVPTLLPPCDLIIMLRSDPVAGFVITGVASAPAVHEQLDGITGRVELDVPDPMELMVLGHDGTPDVADRLGSLPTESFDGFDAVAPDAVVDVPG
jgi:hypothetical protein